MKDIIIVIHGMDCGGAEKSLVSLLHVLDKSDWNVDLLIGNPNGIFMEQIPQGVNIISDCYEFENLMTPLSLRRKKVASVRDCVLQAKWQFLKRIGNHKHLLADCEYKWKSWGAKLPKLKKQYDLAISYMNGIPNFFVIDKIKASHKILWIHNEYDKLGYNNAFEDIYFKKASAIVTISQACADNIAKSFPQHKGKISVLENISSGTMIRKLAQAEIDDSRYLCSPIKILSIGRLMKQKRFDWAIETAKLLVDRGYKFCWYILGEGELREELQELIRKYELDNCFFLIGIKENPYPYINLCDVFVQTSIFEGKSIALDEAKILAKPIVITNYATSNNSIRDKLDGLIVDMSPDKIADGIEQIITDIDLKNRLVDNLSHFLDGNVDERKKYIKLFESFL